MKKASYNSVGAGVTPKLGSGKAMGAARPGGFQKSEGAVKGSGSQYLGNARPNSVSANGRPGIPSKGAGAPTVARPGGSTPAKGRKGK